MFLCMFSTRHPAPPTEIVYSSYLKADTLRREGRDLDPTLSYLFRLNVEKLAFHALIHIFPRLWKKIVGKGHGLPERVLQVHVCGVWCVYKMNKLSRNAGFLKWVLVRPVWSKHYDSVCVSHFVSRHNPASKSFVIVPPNNGFLHLLPTTPLKTRMTSNL